MFKIFQKFLVVTLVSLAGLVPLSAMEGLSTDNNNNRANIDKAYLKGELGNIEKPVGVEGVSYLISPESDRNLFLSLENDSLRFTNDRTARSLFIFKEIQGLPLHFTVSNLALNYTLRNNTQDKCFIDIQSDGKFRLAFKAYGDESRASILQYDLSNRQVILGQLTQSSSTSQVWALRPIYECSDLYPKSIDLDTCLFKLSKVEPVSGHTLSTLQIQALYALHHKNSPHKMLTVVHEDQDHIFAHTPELPYVNGLYIQSEFPIKLFNLKNFHKGVGEFLKDAKEKSKATATDHDIVELDVIELEVGEQFFLKPNYTENQKKLPLLGEIEVKPGQKGILSTTYKDLNLRLKELIKDQGDTLICYKDFVVDFKTDTINFIPTNKFVLTHPGLAAWLGKDIVKTGARIVRDDVLKEVGGIIDRFGENIRKATQDAGNALVKSSEIISKELRFSAITLSNTLKYVADTFDNVVKFLTLEITQEMKLQIPAILRSMERTTKLLSDSLVDASDNLKGGAAEIAGAVKESSQSLEKAFKTLETGLNQALKDSLKDLDKIVKSASEDFVRGMDKIKEAAEQAKNARVKVDWCLIA